ncbi:putative mitochondrial protein, partial [Mucuna pruriens]
MAILYGHELCSLPTRMSILRSSLYSVNDFKMKGINIAFNRSDYEGGFENEKFQQLPMNYGRVDKPIFLVSTFLDDNLSKFDPKSDKGTFIEYSTTSNTYRVYNSRTLKVEESIHVKFNNSKLNKELSKLIEPFNVDKALLDDRWILAMQEELDMFQKNDVWKLVSSPNNKCIIGTKWIFRNKLDENGKALYRLMQTPHAWYEKLSSFLVLNGFQRGKVDTTLFCKNYDSHFINVQIYVDDIIFGVIDDSMCRIM